MIIHYILMFLWKGCSFLFIAQLFGNSKIIIKIFKKDSHPPLQQSIAFFIPHQFFLEFWQPSKTICNHLPYFPNHKRIWNSHKETHKKLYSLWNFGDKNCLLHLKLYTHGLVEVIHKIILVLEDTISTKNILIQKNYHNYFEILFV